MTFLTEITSKNYDLIYVMFVGGYFGFLVGLFCCYKTNKKMKSLHILRARETNPPEDIAFIFEGINDVEKGKELICEAETFITNIVP